MSWMARTFKSWQTLIAVFALAQVGGLLADDKEAFEPAPEHSPAMDSESVSEEEALRRTQEASIKRYRAIRAKEEEREDYFQFTDDFWRGYVYTIQFPPISTLGAPTMLGSVGLDLTSSPMVSTHNHRIERELEALRRESAATRWAAPDALISRVAKPEKTAVSDP